MDARAELEPRTAGPDRFAGALLGCGIGDALGWPFEGCDRAEIVAAGDVVAAYRPARRPARPEPWPPGSYSDDTQQTLVVAESIVALGRVDHADIGRRLYRLWKSGEAVGIGRAFRETMERLDAGVPPDRAASADLPWNGAAMRVGPVALFDWRRPERLVADVVAASQVTHREPSAVAAAVAVAEATVQALTREVIAPRALVGAVCRRVAPLHQELARELERLPEMLTAPEEEARERLLALPGARRPDGEQDGVSVVAIPTTVASLYAFLRSPNDYPAVARRALRLGGDVDTLAAIAGLLAGAHLGTAALPPHLVAGLQDAERIRHLAEDIYRRSGPSTGPRPRGSAGGCGGRSANLGSAGRPVRAGGSAGRRPC